MEGEGETQTSTPNTTDRVRETSRVLDLPTLEEKHTIKIIKGLGDIYIKVTLSICHLNYIEIPAVTL